MSEKFKKVELVLELDKGDRLDQSSDDDLLKKLYDSSYKQMITYGVVIKLKVYFKSENENVKADKEKDEESKPERRFNILLEVYFDKFIEASQFKTEFKNNVDEIIKTLVVKNITLKAKQKLSTTIVEKTDNSVKQFSFSGCFLNSKNKIKLDDIKNGLNSRLSLLKLSTPYTVIVNSITFTIKTTSEIESLCLFENLTERPFIFLEDLTDKNLVLTKLNLTDIKLKAVEENEAVKTERPKLNFVKRESTSKFGLFAVYDRNLDISVNDIEEVISNLDGVKLVNFAYSTNEKDVGLLYLAFLDGSTLLEAKRVLEDVEIAGKMKKLFDTFLEDDYAKKFGEKGKWYFILKKIARLNDHETDDILRLEAELSSQTYEDILSSPQRPRIRKRVSDERPPVKPLKDLADDFQSVQLEESAQDEQVTRLNQQQIRQEQHNISYPIRQMQAPNYAYFMPQTAPVHIPIAQVNPQDPQFHYQFQQHSFYAPQVQQVPYTRYSMFPQNSSSYPEDVNLNVYQRQRQREIEPEEQEVENETEIASTKFDRQSRLYVAFDKNFNGEEQILKDAFKEAAQGFEYISKLGSKTFAFVKYSSSTNAKTAMEKLHETTVGGRFLKVTVAEAPRSKSSKRQRTQEDDLKQDD